MAVSNLQALIIELENSNVLTGKDVAIRIIKELVRRVEELEEKVNG